MEGTLNPKPTSFSYDDETAENPTRGTGLKHIYVEFDDMLILKCQYRFHYSWNGFYSISFISGIQIFELDRNTGSLIQRIAGIRNMNKWLGKQLDSIASDSVLVMIKS